MKGSEVTELIGYVRAAGFKVVKSGSQKHYKIHRNNGTVVADANGPLIISTSPGEHRWREMHVQRLMAAGILKSDPYKPTRGTKQDHANGNGNGNGNGSGSKKKSPLQDPEQAERIHAARVAAIHEKSQEQAEASAKQRARLEPVVVHLGGWGERGTRTIQQGEPMSIRTRATSPEIGDVIHHWARTRGRVELPKDPKTNTYLEPKFVATAIGNLKLGHTVGQKWLPLIEVFLDDLWREAGGDARKAAQRYFELLRQAKGIVDEPASPRPGAPVSDPAPAPTPEREEVKLGPAHDQVAAPTLALRAMYYMGRGSDDIVEALAVASDIAEMELNRKPRGGTA